MKTKEELFTAAINQAKKLCKTGTNSIDEKIKADISSFGTALAMNGLFAAIVQYSDISTEPNKRRAKILNAIYCLVYDDADKPLEGNNDIPTLLLDQIINEYKDKSNPLDIQEKTNELLEAIIHLKLAVRTCKQI